MTKPQLVSHLIESGCILIREDNSGYAVMRNVINGKMSGVPAAINSNGHLKPATVCKICRTLDIEIPREAEKAIGIIDFINKNTNKFINPEK